MILLSAFFVFGTAFYTWRAVSAATIRDKAFNAASAVIMGFMALVALLATILVALLATIPRL